MVMDESQVIVKLVDSQPYNTTPSISRLQMVSNQTSYLMESNSHQHKANYSQSVMIKSQLSLSFSIDSDLEAFSHNLTDDSLPSLHYHVNGLPIVSYNGSSRTKLHYWQDSH